MPYFPQLSAQGLLTQRPYQAGIVYATTVDELQCGLRQRWGWRGMGLTNFPARALGRWDINLPSITDAELAVMHTFFASMRGRLGEFIFVDPAGNLVPDSEDLGATGWTGSGGGSMTTDPFGGNRARSGGGSWSCVVLPTAGADGYIMCASIWAKGPGTATLGLTGAGSTVTQLPSGVWVRAQHSGAVSGSSISASFTTTGAAVFGAQVVPMPGPGGYIRATANPGLHPKCRFDTDKLLPRYVGPNQIELKLPILEYY